MIRILRILAALLISATVYPQHAIRGTVQDARNNERLPNATVMLKGTSIGTKTNTEGVFVLHAPDDSVLMLEARFIGYATLTKTILRGQKEVTFQLKQEEVHSGVVEIVADRMTAMKSEKEVSLTSVSPALLLTLPQVGQADIFRSLQLLPGIGATNDRSSGLYVRGGTPDQNLVLFDGMTVYHVDHLFGFFSAFNPDAVKDVQLYKGGFPAMYGGRLSSVVDMTGKTGDPQDYHVRLGANFLSANALVEIPLYSKGSILIAGRRSFADILGSDTYNSLYKFVTGEDITSTQTRGFGTGGPPGGGGFRGMQQDVLPSSSFDDVNVKVSYALTPRDNASASFYSSGDDVDKSTDASTRSLPGNSGGFTVPSSTDKTTQGNTGVSAKWFRQWDERVFSTFFAASATYRSTYEFGMSRPMGPSGQAAGQNTSKEENMVRDNSFRWDNEWYADERNEIRFGAQFSTLTTTYHLDQNLPFSDAVGDVLDRDEQAVQSAVYLQDVWRGIPLLDMTIGLRAVHYDRTGDFFLEPRLSARYTLSDAFALKGAVGRYHQFTHRIINDNLTEGTRDFWLVADKTLAPSASTHLIAGAVWENDEYVFDVEAYYKAMENLLEFSQRFRRSPEDRYSFYTGSGTAKGIDILLQKKSGRITGWIGYTLGSVEHHFPEMNGGKSFASADDQRHELKCVGEADLGDGWSISSTYIFGSGKPYTSPVSQYTVTLLDSSVYTYTHVSDKNVYRLPAYHRWDISCSYRFGDQRAPWVVGVTAFNVLNHRNVSYYKYDLSTQPMTVTGVTGLGFTPTLFVQVTLR